VNYANERSQAALERSSQDAYDIIRLTCSKATVWTLDDVAHLIKILKKEFLFIYLFVYFYPRYHMIRRDDKNYINHETLQNCTLFVYLFIYYMNIQNILSSRFYNRL